MLNSISFEYFNPSVLSPEKYQSCARSLYTLVPAFRIFPIRRANETSITVGCNNRESHEILTNVRKTVVAFRVKMELRSEQKGTGVQGPSRNGTTRGYNRERMILRTWYVDLVECESNDARGRLKISCTRLTRENSGYGTHYIDLEAIRSPPLTISGSRRYLGQREGNLYSVPQFLCQSVSRFSNDALHATPMEISLTSYSVLF